MVDRFLVDGTLGNYLQIINIKTRRSMQRSNIFFWPLSRIALKRLLICLISSCIRASPVEYNLTTRNSRISIEVAAINSLKHLRRTSIHDASHSDVARDVQLNDCTNLTRLYFGIERTIGSRFTHDFSRRVAQRCGHMTTDIFFASRSILYARVPQYSLISGTQCGNYGDCS